MLSFFEECIIVFQIPAQFPKNKDVSNTTSITLKFGGSSYLQDSTGVHGLPAHHGLIVHGLIGSLHDSALSLHRHRLGPRGAPSSSD